MKKIIVSKRDKSILMNLITNSYSVDPIDKQSQKKLYGELKDAIVLEENEIPNDIVKLNSIITIETTYGRKQGIQLVMPKDADLRKGKLSIMSTMGTAVFGYKEGDKVEWILPKGVEKIIIEKVNNGDI